MVESKATPINSILFEDVCSLFKNISNEKRSAKEKEKLLINFLQEVKINAAKGDDKKDCNLFPLMRLLLPSFERERSYNLKEHRLGQLLQKLLVIPKNSGDGRKLLEFRSVANSKIGSDFPSVAYYVLNSRINHDRANLTIEDVNNTLDKIATAEAGNKALAIDEAFNFILRNSTAVQQTWFLRILLKDLKLGVGKTRILAALHPDAPEYYETCSSLKKVCEEVDEGQTRPLELGIRMFSAISPMLSERFDVAEIEKLFDGNVTYQIETKFDGERFQLHMKDGEFEYFSRRGFSYGDHYGRGASAGLLTPQLQTCFSPAVSSVILDGEMMGWHTQYERFGSKGMAFDIKKTTTASKFRPCFCVFDVLYYNGSTLVGPQEKGGAPLKDRMDILDSLFKDVKGVIQKSRRKWINDKAEVLEALNKANNDQEEGIILKDINSYYIPNRRNLGWYKIKPEYTEGAMVDLDLVIIGADFAENKKQGLAKSFLVACADVEPGKAASRWVLVGRAATGLSFEERERVCSLLKTHWTRSKHEPPPSALCFNKETPDLWILPQHSVVLTVRATELIRSTDFGTSHTLRFPRITHVREDKPVNDILTLHEFNKLVQDKGAVVKLSTTEIHSDQLKLPKAPRKRKAAPLLVAEVFRHQPIDVAVTSQALQRRKVCVLSDDEDCKKDVLERLVVSHGGIVVQNIGPDTWCCIAGRRTMRVKNAIESRQADILPTGWLRGLDPQDRQVAKPTPAVMVAVSSRTRAEMASYYDEYGDSYTRDTDEIQLRRCFDKMDEEPASKIYLTTEEMIEIDEELYPGGHPYSFLRPCSILFHGECTLAAKAAFYGANICSAEPDHVTHVVVSGNDDLDTVKLTYSHCKVVSVQWLAECIDRKEFVPEIDFVL